MKKQLKDTNFTSRVYFNKFDPIIYTKIVDDHIELTIRYLMHPKKARYIESVLYNNIYTIVLPSWRTLDSDLSLCIKLITKLESDSYYSGVTGNIRVISDDKVSFQPTGKLGE